MGFVLTILAVSSIVPWVLYLGQGGGLGPLWGVVVAGQEVVGSGAYRQQQVTRWKLGSAPWVVRLAALSCFYVGQLVVPGGFAALAGIPFVIEPPGVPMVWPVLELAAPTGLCAGAFLLSAGWCMLEGDPEAVHKARRAWRWAMAHNLVLLAALGVATTLDPRDRQNVVVACACACVSVAQALLVRRATSALEAFQAARRRAPVPTNAELDALEEAA